MADNSTPNSTSFNGFPDQAAFLEAVPYHYVPTTWICALFLGLFSVTTLLHLSQGMWFHMWWTLPTAVTAGLGEIIGWTARLWSSKNPLKLDPFLMQISSTIIAPTPLIATNFLILSRVIGRLGPQYSRLSPKWYSILFCGADIIALTVQAVGGAKASDAASNHQDAEPGGHIMLGGIFFQMAALTMYTILAAEFLTRYNMNKPLRHTDAAPGKMTQRLRLQLIGLGIMTVFIFIRSVYRTIELIDGWDGKIISTQWLFNVFDGAMIVLSMFTLNVFHPGYLLNEPVPQFNDMPVAERKVEDIPNYEFSPESGHFPKPIMNISQYGSGPYGAFTPRTKKFEDPLEE